VKNLFLFLILILLLPCSIFALDTYYSPIAHSTDGISADVYFGESGSNILKASSGLNGLEVNISQYNLPDDFGEFISGNVTTMGFQWQIIPEITPIPAIAIGVKDILAHVSKESSFYAVITKDISVIDPSYTLSKFQLSLGYGTNSLNGFFGSANIDIKDRFYISAEAFNREFNWGCGIKIMDFIKAGYMNFDKHSYIGASASFSF